MSQQLMYGAGLQLAGNILSGYLKHQHTKQLKIAAERDRYLAKKETEKALSHERIVTAQINSRNLELMLQHEQYMGVIAIHHQQLHLLSECLHSDNTDTSTKIASLLLQGQTFSIGMKSTRLEEQS